MRLDVARPEPAASQKPAGLESDRDAFDPCPALCASSRQRLSSFSKAFPSTSSFFDGWRSTPGTIPATSQLDRLISITGISVPSGLRGVRDRLRSFNFCMGAPSVHISADECHILTFLTAAAAA
jgi:hypothetical protein